MVITRITDMFMTMAILLQQQIQTHSRDVFAPDLWLNQELSHWNLA